MSSQDPNDLTPRSGASSDSLLGSIQNIPVLKQRLDQIGVNDKTISFSNLAKCAVTTEDRTTDAPANDLFAETVDFSMGNTSLDKRAENDVATDFGFVPRRHIVSAAGKQCKDVDYRLIGQLGAGGTGVVYQAHQRAVDREVAVKMLRNDLACQPLSRERFLAEARVIGGLDHPNVIALHEVYSDDSGALFYSMKRIDGTSWDKQIDELSLTQNIENLLRVSDAIRYAHSRGLIHRDIKPENVMLGKFGEVLLADWGLAVHHQDQRSVEDAAHLIGGTPAYMAPELACAAVGAITFQTDVYLLGAVLYQILTGSPPHRGSTLLECIQAAANNLIEPTDVEGGLIDVSMRAMATRPEERYSDVDGFIGAIKKQNEREQSERLMSRAVRQVEGINHAAIHRDTYRDFGIADALLAESLEIWPENLRALEIRKRLQLQFASIATERGDYDLAMGIYESVGETESDEAVMLRFHKMRRDASQKHVSRYSVLFTQSPDAGLLVQMESSTIVEANIAFAKLFGYHGDQVIGQRIGDLRLWADPEEQHALDKEVQQRGSVDDFAAQMMRTDGRIVDVTISSRIVEVVGEKMILSTYHDRSREVIAEVRQRRKSGKRCGTPIDS